MKSDTNKYRVPVEVVFKTEGIDEYRNRRSLLAQALGLHPITAGILIARGIEDPEEAKSFLAPSFTRDLPDPSCIKNISSAADFILDAIEAEKQITAYSDFDVDGLSSAAQLVIFLHAIGGRVNSYTPNRFSEGYGLAASAVRSLAKSGTRLLITLDCGISNEREIELAKTLGLTTIVVDHHIPDSLPPADVVVDPAQGGCPFESHGLATAGLVWMLLVVLRACLKKRRTDVEIPDPKEFLDLACLGTICDMVPLRGVNRLLAYRGLEALSRSERAGISALKDVSGCSKGAKLSAGHVGFGLGPRINAAGRLGDTGTVFKLLTTDSKATAKRCAKALDRINEKRRRIEERAEKACIDIISKKSDVSAQPAFAIYDDSFHIGVVGIVAQRMVEHYYRPVALMAPGEKEINGKAVAVIRGSVRGIPGFHVAESLQSLSELLITYGGHKGAGGFTLDPGRLSEFESAFVEEAGRRLVDPSSFVRRMDISEVIAFSDIDMELVEELGRLAPFGIGNPAPVFLSRDVTVESLTPLGNSHLKLRLNQEKRLLTALAWGLEGHPLLCPGEKIDVAYQTELNTYKGITSVQLNLKGLWPTTESGQVVSGQ